MNGSDRRCSFSRNRVRRTDPNRRQFVKATAGVATGVSVAGCLDTLGTIVGGAESDEPVTIGVLAPSPKSNFIGRSMVRSAEVAVDELNRTGGIDGRPVELAVGDTNGSPTEARRQYQQLILEDGADVTVGVFDSTALMNILDDIAEQETVHLTSGAATAAVGQLVSDEYERYKYHFRAGPTNNRHLGRAMIAFLRNKAPDIGWESIALLAEDYEWTNGPWSVYQDELDDLGFDVTLERRYPPAIDDFEPIYDQIAQAGADATIITTAHTGTDALLDWSYPNRPDSPPQPYPFAFGGIHVPLQLPTYYEQTNGACRYSFAQTSATATSEVGELTGEFVSAYQDAFDGANPVYTGYHTYDAVRVFAEAATEAGTLESDELVSALEATTFEGAGGTIEFYDRDHEFAHDLVYNDDDTLFFQWQENDDGRGVQEVVWPDEHATSEFVSPPWV